MPHPWFGRVRILTFPFHDSHSLLSPPPSPPGTSFETSTLNNSRHTVNNVLCFTCYAEGTLLLCHFGPPYSLVRTEKPANSFVSPTSTKFSCNPFVSPTYAKTGGVGSACYLAR